MLKVLVIFSTPPDRAPLRLDQEDRIIAHLAREFAGSVTVERLHASQIDDIHKVIADGHFDVIQFSGHGSSDGVYLDKSDLEHGRGELVSAARFQRLMDCAVKHPQIVVLLCCYADEHIKVLASAAPFVITSGSDIEDRTCIVFMRGFYECFFRGHSVQASFSHALNLLGAKGMPFTSFQLSRRCLVHRHGSRLLESLPDPMRDSIWVNLDKVAHRLGAFGMLEEELCHLISRKIRIHSWIFDMPRERAIIPIGRSLFGEFSWRNAADVVYCTRLMKLSPETPVWQWELWSRLLTSYNDLASHEYRNPNLPPSQKRADPTRQPILDDAVRLFRHYVQKYLEPTQAVLEKQREFQDLLPHIGLALAEVERAKDHLHQKRLREVVIALELALTNYHEVADGLQPPEDVTEGQGQT